jgi:hypothetical protein
MSMHLRYLDSEFYDLTATPFDHRQLRHAQNPGHQALAARQLIVRMARENFLWGAPRIHCELLMLGFTISQATVSRYMPPANRRPGQSWRTFIHNQALALHHDQNSEKSTGDDEGLRIRFYRGTLVPFATPMIGACFNYDYGRPVLSTLAISPWSAPHYRGVWQPRRPLAVSDRSWQAVSDRGRVAVPMRTPRIMLGRPRRHACRRLKRSDQPITVPALPTLSALQHNRSN